MYLLDTHVVSELRRKKPHGAVVAWVQSIDDQDLYLSSVTLAGIQAGIEITRDQDAERAAELEVWLDEMAATYNILDLDGNAFRVWAKLMHKKSDTLYENGMIAAIAKVNKLIVVTRNITDFEFFEVKLLNPFEYKV